jgi:hypothetical protein
MTGQAQAQDESMAQLRATYERMKSNQQPTKPSIRTTVSAQSEDENIIKWQLDLDSLLERAERILRGHNLTVNGSAIAWTDENSTPILSEYGVQKVMKILCLHVNRDIILSNFDEKTINWTVLDFSNQLNELFYTERESMGLDTVEKLKDVPMIVGEITRLVHATYLRALNGGERESLSKQTLVKQDITPQGYPMQMGGMGMPMKERSAVNPLRYLLGKYKT